MKSKPGTYALILRSNSNTSMKIGRWGSVEVLAGYYLYVGSAFGPGGICARIARHLRTDKRLHWHIDYLRTHAAPVEAWISYAEEHLEHRWANSFQKIRKISPVKGFGCSDCNCYTHLFYAAAEPEFIHFSKLLEKTVEVQVFPAGDEIDLIPSLPSAVP